MLFDFLVVCFFHEGMKMFPLARKKHFSFGFHFVFDLEEIRFYSTCVCFKWEECGTARWEEKQKFDGLKLRIKESWFFFFQKKRLTFESEKTNESFMVERKKVSYIFNKMVSLREVNTKIWCFEVTKIQNIIHLLVFVYENDALPSVMNIKGSNFLQKTFSLEIISVRFFSKIFYISAKTRGVEKIPYGLSVFRGD